MSQLDSESKIIDGTKYSVLMLPPKISRKILVELVQTIAPGLSVLGSDAESIAEALSGGALSSVANRIKDENLDWMMEELAKVTRIHVGDKAPILSTIFDIHFKGKIGAMFAWFWFALKVQYGNFWNVWSDGFVPDLQTLLAGLGSESPSTSIGEDGDSLPAG